MDLIIEFYKSLDVLNLIIFWGIIIVIILLIIFSSIVINKNKIKNRNKFIEDKDEFQEELPIKYETVDNGYKVSDVIIDNNDNEEKKIKNEKEDNIEKEFIAEEYVNSFRNTTINNECVINKSVEIPSKPYQRNVLKEMSLNQTSPIGITTSNYKKSMELAKDLSESLNEEENFIKNEIEINNTIKSNFENDTKNGIDTDMRKSEISNLNEIHNCKVDKKNDVINKNMKKENDIFYNVSAKDLLDDISVNDLNYKKSDSEMYLEEVSKKLSEADVIDDIKRTEYELEQEENAIISYQELMEKKDSIQMVDEEEVVISIEELMQRRDNLHDKIDDSLGDSKLYNISEEEENDNFLRELKEFRKDL